MNHTCRLAVIAPQLSDTVSMEILSGIIKRAAELHYELDIISAGGVDDSNNRLYKSLIENVEYSGIIVFTGLLSYETTLDRVDKLLSGLGSIPILNLSVAVPGYLSLVSDNIKPVEELTDHLITEHHIKHFMFIKGPENQVEAEERFTGFRQSLDRHGITIDKRYIFPGNFTPHMGSEAVKSLLKSGLELPEVIMCANDDTALGVYTECRKSGIQIGEGGILVTGYDNMGYTLTMDPALTTVDQNFDNMGIEAVNTMSKVIGGVQYSSIKSVPNVLYRSSCGCSDIISRVNNDGINLTDLILGRMDDLKIDKLEDHIDRIAEMLNQFSIKKNYSFIDDFEEIIYMYRYKGYNLKVLTEILKLLGNRLMIKLDRESVVSYFSQVEEVLHTIIDVIKSEKVIEFRTQKEQNTELDNLLVSLASVKNYEELDMVLSSNLYYLGIDKIEINLGDVEYQYVKNNSLNRSRSPYLTLYLPLVRGEESGYCKFHLISESFRIAEVINSQLSKSLNLIKLLQGLNEKVVRIENSYNDLRMTRDSIMENEQLANIGGLVAGFTHEIGTPIGVSVTATTYMEESLKSFKKKLESGSLKKSDMNTFLGESINNLDIITNNLKRTASLISGFKQISVDQASDVKREIELTSYLDEVAHSLSPILRRKRHRVEIISQEKILIYTYPGAISQIFTNLIQNSVKHGFEFMEEGKITITVERSGQDITITYQDNGVGIGKDVQEKVFETWYSTKIGKGGSGLGLSIIKKLIEDKLLGSISCSGEKEDGARFEIKLKKLFDSLPG